MSDNRDQRPGGYDAADPWAPPNRDGVEIAKGSEPSGPTAPGAGAVPRQVHDQPTVTSMPSASGPGAAEVPPPPVAPGGAYAYPSAPTPPPVYGTPAPGAAPGGYGYPPAGYGAVPYGPPLVRNNGLGTAGMVLGIIGVALFWFYGIPAIVLGILALIFGLVGRKRVQRGEADNGGSATAGVILGSISIALGILVIVFFAWFFATFADELDDYESQETGATVLVVNTPR